MQEKAIGAIAATKTWINEVVVGLQFCPFAAPVIKQDGLHVVFSEANDRLNILTDLMLLVKQMDEIGDIQTALLVFELTEGDFEAYLDMVEEAEYILSGSGYDGVYQLATFHPQYCFEGTNVDEASNFTNRSPYPMLHLLREDDLEKAISHYPNTDEIPERNVKVAEEKGKDYFERILNKLKGSL